MPPSLVGNTLINLANSTRPHPLNAHIQHTNTAVLTVITLELDSLIYEINGLNNITERHLQTQSR